MLFWFDLYQVMLLNAIECHMYFGGNIYELQLAKELHRLIIHTVPLLHYNIIKYHVLFFITLTNTFKKMLSFTVLILLMAKHNKKRVFFLFLSLSVWRNKSSYCDS